MSTLFSLADFRQALRRLARERGFSATVLLTLALCIGANVTIYAVVDAILVRSLPFPDADRLVTAIKIYPGAGVSRSGISIANYVDWRQSITAFSSMAVIQAGAAIVGEPGNPSRIQRDRVSTQFFSTLGVPLAMGREFQEAELSPANSHVAILTDEYWRNNFAADSNVLGRKFQVDGAPFTIVGVLPAGFHYLTSRAQFFVPLSWRPAETTIDNRHTNRIWLVARLAPGATLTSAGAQITAFDTHQFENDPNVLPLKSSHYAAVLQFLHED